MNKILNRFSIGEILRFLAIIVGTIIIIFILSAVVLDDQELNDSENLVDCSENPQLAKCQN